MTLARPLWFLVFVDVGVKIDHNVYHRDILDAVVAPWAMDTQQNSAPAHRVKATQDLEWCEAYVPDFTSEESQSYSQDLNLMDYSIWSNLEVTACAKPHKNLEAL